MKSPSKAPFKSRPVANYRRTTAFKFTCLFVLLAITLCTIQVIILMRYQHPSDLEQEIAQTSSSNDDETLPKWITDYFRWHKDVRAKYPGTQLFLDPDAPKLIIRTCLGLCGGLNDRLGQLPWDLYLANQTQRILLLRWERPRPLENFLVPNDIDWSVPAHAEGFGDMKAVRAITPLFQDYADDHPDDDFWASHLDKALERANTGEFKNVRVLRHRLLGHLAEDVLEERLRALGETDMIHSTRSFGNIFRAFFKPSQGVKAQLQQVYSDLNLSPGQYTAVHCRVRHPKATVAGVVVHGKFAKYPADKTGLPWYGETKDFAVAVATHAIQCARTLSADPKEPIYFMSDSNDLVRYIAHELNDNDFISRNASLFDNKHDVAALKAVKATNIVAREVTLENAHIDRQKGRKPKDYYATFTDLLLAANARCVTFGIGFYAIFATKISGKHTAGWTLFTLRACVLKRIPFCKIQGPSANYCIRKKSGEEKKAGKNQKFVQKKLISTFHS